MAVKRYLFLGDGTRLDRIVSRYVAMDDPANDAGMPASELAAMQRHRAKAREQDLLAPSEWCWADADAVELAADDPSLWQPSAQTAAFLGRNLRAVDRFLHFCDMDLAQAWLDIAQRLVASDSAIDALPRERQFEVCRDAWMSLGNVFRALNVRPYGWQKYRYQWEWALGNKVRFTAEPRLIVDEGYGTRYEDNPPAIPRPLRSAPVLFPTLTEAERLAGTGLSAWRTSLKASYNGHGSNQSQQATRGVIIGVKSDWDEAARNKQAGAYFNNGAGCFSDLRTTAQHCFTPTEDVLYVWMGNDGVIAGNRMPAAGIRTWRSMSWLYDPSFMPSGVLFATAPMKWYVDMLRTILRDIASRDFFSLIHEIRLDVIGKNAWTNDIARGIGIDASHLEETFAVTTQEREMSESRRTIALLGSAATLASVINPIAGAVVGLFFSVASAINELVPIAADSIIAASTIYTRDIFGRITPTFEIFQMDSSARMGQDVSYIANVLPPPPPGYESAPTPVQLFVPLLAIPRQSVVDTARQGVVVLGIPPFSVVFVNDSPNGNVGSTVIGTEAAPLWFTPTPTGDVDIRVLTLDQSIRTARVTVTANRIASIPFQSMTVVRPASTTVGRLTVTGQPGWRIALAMDGTTTPLVAVNLPASGESVSEWPVGSYMVGVDDGQGHVAARRVTLSATPTVVDAAALLTSSAQQRQIASGGSNAGTYLAVGVGILAAGLFVATVMLDGPKKQRNPKRR